MSRITYELTTTYHMKGGGQRKFKRTFDNLNKAAKEYEDTLDGAQMNVDDDETIRYCYVKLFAVLSCCKQLMNGKMIQRKRVQS